MSLGDLLDKGNVILEEREKQLKRIRERAFKYLADMIGSQATTEIKESLIEKEEVFDNGEFVTFRFHLKHERTGKFVLGVEALDSEVFRSFLAKKGEIGYFYNAKEFSEYLARVAKHSQSINDNPIGFRKKPER